MIWSPDEKTRSVFSKPGSGSGQTVSSHAPSLTAKSRPRRTSFMPIAVFALSLAAFCIGTTEFIVSGAGAKTFKGTLDNTKVFGLLKAAAGL